MSGTFLLARRYLAHHRGRTALLVAAVALTALLPIAVHLLVARFSGDLNARARATPLLLGAPGSRYDLVLNALYFTGRVPRALTMAEYADLQDTGLVRAYPIHAVHHAERRPVVGTSVDYFELRGLRLGAGSPFALLGECVLGARVAADLGLGVGDRLLSDQGSLYDLTLRYPLRMHVVGVLAEAGTPDDDAVFVDVRTAWVMDGIGHGHEDASSASAAAKGLVLGEKNGEVVLNAAVVEYQEIDEENAGTFHFHGDPDTFPLTAVIVVPLDPRSGTLLKGRYRVETRAQLVTPTEVVGEILGFVLKLKRFFDANATLVGAATVLFLALVVLLSLRLRRREAETLFKLGCARMTITRVLGTELLLCMGIGILLAGAGALAVVTFVPRFGG